jgi:hypothetical protein
MPGSRGRFTCTWWPAFCSGCFSSGRRPACAATASSGLSGLTRCAWSALPSALGCAFALGCAHTQHVKHKLKTTAAVFVAAVVHGLGPGWYKGHQPVCRQRVRRGLRPHACAHTAALAALDCDWLPQRSGTHMSPADVARAGRRCIAGCRCTAASSRPAPSTLTARCLCRWCSDAGAFGCAIDSTVQE